MRFYFIYCYNAISTLLKEKRFITAKVILYVCYYFVSLINILSFYWEQILRVPNLNAVLFAVTIQSMIGFHSSLIDTTNDFEEDIIQENISKFITRNYQLNPHNQQLQQPSDSKASLEQPIVMTPPPKGTCLIS